MRLPNTRMQRTRSSPSALRSPLMRCPLGLAGGFGVMLLVLVGLSECRRSDVPAVAVTEEEERRLLFSIACSCRQQKPVRDVTERASSWRDESQVREALKSLRFRTEARPALLDETIADFIRKTRADELTLQPTFSGEHDCLAVRFLSSAEMKGPDIHSVMALSRVGFNRRGNQALVVVFSHAMDEPGGRGSSETLIFLTKPLNVWVAVGWAPGPIA